MKHGKKPTLAQRKEMKAHGLNSDEWLVIKCTPDEFTIKNRWSKKVRTYPREKY